MHLLKCNLQQNYDECGFANPLRCELGDQAKKLGKYDVGKGRRFYTDVYLPLMGQFGGTFFFLTFNKFRVFTFKKHVSILNIHQYRSRVLQ